MGTKQITKPTSAGERGRFLKTEYIYIRRLSTNDMLYLWFKYKGKRYQPSLETKSLSVAVIRANAKKREIKERIQASSLVVGKITFGELLAQFLLDHEQKVEVLTNERIIEIKIRNSGPVVVQ